MSVYGQEPISVAEATDLIRRTLSIALNPQTVPDGVDGTGFVFVTPATGQRFRVEVSEITAPALREAQGGPQ